MFKIRQLWTLDINILFNRGLTMLLKFLTFYIILPSLKFATQVSALNTMFELRNIAFSVSLLLTRWKHRSNNTDTIYLNIRKGID